MNSKLQLEFDEFKAKHVKSVTEKTIKHDSSIDSLKKRQVKELKNLDRFQTEEITAHNKLMQDTHAKELKSLNENLWESRKQEKTKVKNDCGISSGIVGEISGIFGYIYLYNIEKIELIIIYALYI